MVVATAFMVVPAGNARADGAFPDSGQVLLPGDRPHDIILGTNFGLIATSDGGTTWEWTCETPLLTMGQSYQLGISAQPGSAGRLVAASLWGVVYSDDSSCSWEGSNGDIAQTSLVTDVFVQRADPRRVYAIGLDATDSAGQMQKAYTSAMAARRSARLFLGHPPMEGCSGSREPAPIRKRSTSRTIPRLSIRACPGPATAARRGRRSTSNRFLIRAWSASSRSTRPTHERSSCACRARAGTGSGCRPTVGRR